jgi:hypothetical protein
MMIKAQKNFSWSPTHLLTGDRIGNSFGLLQVYDWMVAEGLQTLGSASLAHIMKGVEENVKYLEGLGKRSPYVLCWALTFRAGILRRQGKPSKALKLLGMAHDSASRTSSKACTSYLWLERGFCEELIFKEKKKPSKDLRNTISPEKMKEAFFVKSFRMALDESSDCGAFAIGSIAKEKLKEINENKHDLNLSSLSRTPLNRRSSSALPGRRLSNALLSAALERESKEGVRRSSSMRSIVVKRKEVRKTSISFAT